MKTFNAVDHGDHGQASKPDTAMMRAARYLRPMDDLHAKNDWLRQAGIERNVLLNGQLLESPMQKAMAASIPAQAAAPRPQGPTLENQTLAQLIDARRKYGSLLGGQIGTRAYGGVPGVPRAGYAQGYAPAKIEIPADQQKLLEPAQAPRNPIMTASWR